MKRLLSVAETATVQDEYLPVGMVDVWVPETLHGLQLPGNAISHFVHADATTCDVTRIVTRNVTM